MPETRVMTGAEPFFFEGGEVGCLVSHGFTGTTQSMRFLGEFLASEGGLTVVGPRLKGHGTSVEDMARASAEDKRLLWLENSYHVATLDHDKELIARETLKFFQDH